MDKLKMETEDLTSENIEKLKELFPSVVSDGKIDFDKLKQELSADIVKTVDSYDFTWVGKHEAVRKANEPVNAVLRPCPEESKNWEKTKNIYIEGDNLDVLKVLYKSYAGQIKMIYIDPPYNTGSDLIYNDTFTQNLKEYNSAQHLSDEQGLHLKKVTDTDGNYHRKWCSMMYPRLKMARKLLSEDGVIFISIDDHEQANLKKICDEIFGEGNFLYQLSVVNNLNGNDNSSGMMETQEFCLLYAKDKSQSIIGVLPLDEEDSSDWKIDELGYWKLGRCLKASGINAPREARPNLFFPIYINENTLEFTVDEQVGTDWYHLIPLTEGKEMSWYWSKETFKNESNEVIVKKTSEGYSLYKKQRPALGDLPSKRGKTTFYSPKYANANSNSEIKKLFNGKKIFDYSKSTQLIKDFISLGNILNDGIILDFFSGSATTAHAVMQLNAEDGGNRKFIMVQVPEPCDEKSEYKNICEIGKERIRRAGEKIVADTGRTDLNIGFRVFKLDSSNMKDVYFTPDELIQKEGADIEDLADNVKPDRTPADLLFGVMQYWNMTECLGLPHATKEIDGRTIHIIQDGQFPELVACFDADVSETVIKEMAALNPLRAVFRERCFKTTQDRLNAERLLKNADIRLI